ncbi:MAG: ATP-binding protein [Candidatus Thiodiazotropha sp. (ex. Lucinisca nassula)]|nr:ATP-binding protein [Candidatus Thiodiazotropha sp. (ex. Lucinisca nassula)]
MKIHDISIRNYRGIDLLDHLSIGDLNTFVGKNDYGKSTILKSLDAFFNDKFTHHDVYKGINDDEVTEITVRFLAGEDINYLALDTNGFICLTKKFSFTAAGKLKKEFIYTCNDIEHETIQNCWGVKEADINGFLDSLGIAYTRSGRGVTNLSKIEQICEATAGLDRYENSYEADDYIKNITKQYDSVEYPDYALFDAEQDLSVGSTDFQNQFKPIATQSLNNNKGLTDQIESNVQGDLNTEFSQITSLMQKNVPELEAIVPVVQCNWKNLVKFDLGLKFKSESHDIPISHKGTGFKRLLMVAYFEYLANKESSKYNIFGIEEPETFLHPELQYELLSSIIELSDNSQFFITTHSPVFAGATSESNIVVVRKENSISRYFNHENEIEIIKMVIDELGIRPDFNLLNENIRKVVFVEGKGDCLFWELALKKLNGGKPEDIMFVPCGGDQVEFFVNAELCRKLNRNFIFILDSDKGAVDFESKERNKNELKGKVESMGGGFEILKKREIENYYHREAIQRVIGDQLQLPDDFVVGDYTDMHHEIKEKILKDTNINFKVKNNTDVFSEMSKEEWSAVGVAEGDTTDLENIVRSIVS